MRLALAALALPLFLAPACNTACPVLPTDLDSAAPPAVESPTADPRMAAPPQNPTLSESTWEFLTRSRYWSLVRLDPRRTAYWEGAPAPGTDVFHGFEVLGRVDGTGAPTRSEILEALQRGVREHDGTRAKCFRPHFGIRARIDDRALDLLLSFECNQIQVLDLQGNLLEEATTAVFPTAVLERNCVQYGL